MKNRKSISGKHHKTVFHNKGHLLLMAIPIVIIIGFQIYWLRENFFKEKKTLELRTNLAFSEAILKIQSQKLKLDKIFIDSSGVVRVGVSGSSSKAESAFNAGKEMAGYLNEVTIRLNDSLKSKIPNRKKIIVDQLKINSDSDKISLPVAENSKRTMIVSVDNSDHLFQPEAESEIRMERKGRTGEIVRFLYGVDSLQDSLRISEIDSMLHQALHKDEIRIDFSISRIESLPKKRVMFENKAESNKVTIGFAHPVTFELKLKSAISYLLKKIFSQILFSLFLVGVTIFSFALLYRNLQKQRRLAAIKNDFINNITHELKTPIATVAVAIEALRNFNATNNPQRTKEYLDISQNELQRLSLLVDKVLKLSMFENKEIELKYELFDFKDVVKEVVSSMKLQIEKNHATVSIITEGDTNLKADKLHLLSVVYNLLDNALKYGNGNTAIKIEVKEKGNDIDFSIADNGIGIATEYTDKIFEKFFRVPDGNKHNTKGYGLGLSYVAHVVQKHYGKVEVESQPGVGTRFIITLPKGC